MDAKLAERLESLAKTVDSTGLAQLLAANQGIINQLAQLGLDSLMATHRLALPAPKEAEETEEQMIPHADAARTIGVTVGTVTSWIKADRLHGCEKASERKWLVPKSEVERMTKLRNGD